MVSKRVPDIGEFKENLSDDVGSHRVKHNSFNGVVMPVDYFQNIGSGSHLKGNAFRVGGSLVLDVFGCPSCRWMDTVMCPHRDNGVSSKRWHTNRICTQRLLIPKQLHDEGVRMTGKRMLQVRGLMDAAFFSKYKQDQALAGKCDVNDVFPWEKLSADILRDMIKQDEGSKLNVVRSSLDELRRTIDVDVTKDVKEIDDYDNQEHIEETDSDV